jgi:hypothetical protein
VNTLSFSKLLTFSAALTISLLTNLAGASEIYKWVDQNGNTHYADKKPSHTDTTSIKIRSSKSQQHSNVQNQAKALDEKNAAAIQAQEQTSQEEARQREIEAKCERIRENLKVIAETSRIRVVEDGKPRYLSEEEITAKKARHEEQLQEFCQ